MYVALRTKKRPVKLSVQDVMDCSGMEKCKGRGGNEPAVFRWVAEHGVKTDKSYPYKENDSVSCPRNTPQRRKYGLADAFYLPPSNEQILKKILALYGPVCVSLHSSLQSFVAYRSGKKSKSCGNSGWLWCPEWDGIFYHQKQVFRWVAEHGVKTDKSYPYKENDSVSCPRNTPQRRKYGLADAFYLPPSNEQILKKILALYGPVCVSLHSSLQSFVAYRSEKVNHAVIAVGYGVQNGMEYFIIKNSWGPTWGQKGYGRIRAGVFMCGIGHFSNVPIFK
uniref:Bm12796 n=1 Tax=Brugia malayi TaxID=6279 RepID=A0A0J9Y457_BRUMA|nr:Bm12796 [Brugia malayi]